MTVKPKEIGKIIPCLCCGLPRNIYMDARTAQQVCDQCKQHHARDLNRVINLHRTWWLAYTTEAADRFNLVVANYKKAVREKDALATDVQAKLSELTDLVDADYQNAPIGELQTWMQSLAVKAAENRVRSAFRTRDAAMAKVWKLDDLHKEGKSRALCFCGKPEAKCKDREELVDIQNNLVRWESQQIERLKNGKEHGLPREHPEVMKNSSRGYGYGWRR